MVAADRLHSESAFVNELEVDREGRLCKGVLLLVFLVAFLFPTHLYGIEMEISFGP
jgi:hypothetical protein